MNPDRPWTSVAILLVDEAAMTGYNQTVFGKARPTDVISLAYPPLPGPASEGWRGEVLVNVECAWREGRRRGRPARELALYLAHGLHHLTGADDTRPDERRAMRRVENAWLRAADREGLLDGLFPGGEDA